MQPVVEDKEEEKSFHKMLRNHRKYCALAKDGGRHEATRLLWNMINYSAVLYRARNSLEDFIPNTLTQYDDGKAVFGKERMNEWVSAIQHPFP